MSPFWQNPSLTGHSEQRTAICLGISAKIGLSLSLRVTIRKRRTHRFARDLSRYDRLHLDQSAVILKFPLEIQVAPNAGDIAAEVCAGTKACGKTVGEAPGK